MHIANCFRIYGRWTFSETYFIYILLSTSAPGLQEKNRYSWQILWWLVSTVNTQKTKIMVSNNAGRLSNVQFKLNNTVLECVHRYKYLGLTFCSSGSFMYAQEELYNKASKAYFKLSKDLLSLNPVLHTSMHVFDHTIKPILLYIAVKFGEHSTLSLQNSDMGCRIYLLTKFIVSKKLNFCTRNSASTY